MPSNTRIHVQQLLQSIKSFPNGYSGGLDGLTPQHLKEMFLLSAEIPVNDAYLATLIDFLEIVVQGRVGQPMNDNLSINGGLGLRMGDAVQVLLGADYKQYKFGASYDVNISGLSAASSTIGGFELAMIYTGIINKKPKLKPIIICPRL